MDKNRNSFYYITEVKTTSEAERQNSFNIFPVIWDGNLTTKRLADEFI